MYLPQIKKAHLAVAVLFLVTSACTGDGEAVQQLNQDTVVNQDTVDSNENPALVDQTQEVSPTQETRTLDELRQGMPYSEARIVILASGWLGLSVLGQDGGELFGREGEMVDGRGWTELQSCAGSGLSPCRFEFANAEGTKLVVITRGENDDPAVSSWEFE